MCRRHYGEFPGTDVGRAQDGNSTRVMTDILRFENPDFVVFTGDFITGDAIVRNSTGFIDTLLTPVVQGGYR
jgi:predicted MPP superfamily phosphohydrolase